MKLTRTLGLAIAVGAFAACTAGSRSEDAIEANAAASVNELDALAANAANDVTADVLENEANAMRETVDEQARSSETVNTVD